MGRLSDLWVAMTIRRANRINAAEADRLLAGQSTDAGRAGVVALLSEASAAARPAELAGEAAAIEDYLRVRSATPSTVERAQVPWYGPSPGRTIAIRVAVGLVLLSAVGTVTVHFGYLPIRMQQEPGDTSSSSASVPSPSPSSPEARHLPGSLPSAGPLPSPTGPTEPAAVPAKRARASAGTGRQVDDGASTVALCQTWMDDRQAKAVRDEVAQRLQSRMATLDGANGIPAFCRKLLDPSGTTTASTTTGATTTGAGTTGATPIASPGKPTPTASEPTAKAAKSTAKATKGVATAPATATAKNVSNSKNHG